MKAHKPKPGNAPAKQDSPSLQLDPVSKPGNPNSKLDNPVSKPGNPSSRPGNMDDELRDILTRKTPEIARVLAILHQRGEPILSHVARGELQFVSRLRKIDPACKYIEIDMSPDADANSALLSRLRAIFHATLAGRYFEFAAPDPKKAVSSGVHVIRLGFPDVLASHSRRGSTRARLNPGLRCVADSTGDMPFDAEIVDIGSGGVALFYPADISLEPGTPLQGCQVEVPGGRTFTIDLEVRYSQHAMLSDDGKPTQRSGCRFAQVTPDVRELVSLYVKKDAASVA